jgi:beta-ribofuranosylaminobenzene 5'-phosphate synthase
VTPRESELNHSAPASSVTVTVPARLHFGFLDLNGGLGRRFGSMGLALGGPRTRLTIRPAATTEISGAQGDRVTHYLAAMQDLLDLDAAHRVTIEEAIPAHAGLGSGTQLALAVAAGVRRLHGLPFDMAGDAVRLGRGARSGVGIGLFDRGGVVVDGGHGAGTRAAPIVSRLHFPEHWRVLVVLDPARQGAHGPDEAAAFAGLPVFSDQAAAHLCRLVLMQALPALAEHDLVMFGTAIREMQRVLGAYFAPAQGGSRFVSPLVMACLDALEDAGAHGVGQSSWGPTGFAFAPSPEEADRLARTARRHPSAKGLDIRVCTGLNRGADITARAAAEQKQPAGR